MDGFIPWSDEYRMKYEQKGYWEGITVGEALDRAADYFSKNEALVYAEQRFTYGQLKVISDNLAVKLLESGLKPTDRAIFQLPNVSEFVFCYLACLKIGVIPVMCLPAHRFSEISQLAKKSEAKAYFIPDTFRKFNYMELAQEIRAEVPSIDNIFVVGEQPAQGMIHLNALISDVPDYASEEVLEELRLDPSQVAVFLLSGGTTGLPKIIPRTHNDYLYTAKINAMHMGFNRFSVYLAVAPLAHNMTLACPGITGTFLYGGKVVLTNSSDTKDICAIVAEERITNLPMVPAMIVSLLNFPEREKYDLTSLLAITSGGAKLNSEVAKRITPELGCGLYQQFGMAEGLLTMTDPTDSDQIKFETVGRPLSPADEIKIVDEEGRELPLGETGELWCRGPYTFNGYYLNEEYNSQVFSVDGFFQTGDVMRLDPKSGCLIVAGRKKDLINRGGEKISAEEIENLILAHPKISNVAVVAMPDEVLGERACAYVVLKAGQTITLSEINVFLLEKRIAKFKMPEHLEIVDQFPLTNVGKISKKDLRVDIEMKLKNK